MQTRDDLSGWIYQQIQYVAKAPASRSALLVHAVDEAWRHPRTAEEVQAWQDLLINEGYALLLSGAIVPSTDAYTAAYDWASRHPEGTDSVSMVEYILKPLGNNYTRLGDYEQALFIHQKALSLAGSGKDNEALAGTYSNLANTCSNMGRPQQSLEYCRKGLAVANTSSALFGLLLSEQADACQQLERWDEARSSIDKSIAVLERSLHRDRNSAAGYWLLMAYQQAGDIYLAQPAKALSYYQRALALQDQLSQQQGEMRQREQAKLFQRLSVLYTRLHQNARAIYWSDRCLSVLVPGKKIGELQEADLYAENTLADVLYTRAGLAKGLGSMDEALRLFSRCFSVGKKLRQELITGSSRELAVADTRKQYEEAIGTAWDAWKRTENKKYTQAMLYFMESSKAQLLLEEVIRQQPTGGRYPGDSLESRVRLLERARIYYEKEALQSPQNDSIAAVHAAQEKQVTWELAQVRKKVAVPTEARREYLSKGYVYDAGFSIDSLHVLLDDNQLGRLFFQGSSALYVVECSAAGINFVEKLPFAAQWEDSVRGFIRTWFQQGANAMIDDPLRYYQEAYGIYRMLFGTHPLQPGQEYILFPDGPLSLLPVEALVTGSNCPPSPADWPFVIKQAAISYGWSLETLLKQRTNAATESGFSGFFLSGNQGSSPLLEAVGGEEEGIKRAIKSGSWYTDSQATAARFYQALGASAVVHVSSHAFTQKGGLDVPHIEFYDEPFYLFELQGLTHHPALVVLSACRTADGRMVTGEGVQSLARAFTAGGAKAVVAGWWNLNDETAAQLMERYYAALTEDTSTGDRVNAADALRRVKLAWLSDATVPYLHKLPYFWAGLGYLGDPTPVSKGSFGEKKGPRWWPLLVAICAMIIILVYARGRRGHNPA
ncbi:hypothetical protein GCM10011511_40660 [Puia dinghuensis]|uniref:CHAT domain-containing protein n=1 Tax=Puia dinghuensis TaxID=1792502 RepID=A0A8J2UGJ3_9BACT|nr:hypothetical protein GCM10011511_40660 [Puia dinghuensis]